MKVYKVVNYEIDIKENNERYSTRFKDGTDFESSIDKNGLSHEVEKMLNNMGKRGWQLKQIIPIQVTDYSYQTGYKNNAGFSIPNTKYLKIVFEKEKND